MDSAETALEKLNTGELCTIGSSNKISIKTAQGTMQELQLSAKKYLELFPPVEKYIMVQNEKIGDCYLVSSLYSMQAQNSTKVNLLQCFSENSDGSLTISLPESDFFLQLRQEKN